MQYAVSRGRANKLDLYLPVLLNWCLGEDGVMDSRHFSRQRSVFHCSLCPTDGVYGLVIEYNNGDTNKVFLADYLDGREPKKGNIIVNVEKEDKKTERWEVNKDFLNMALLNRLMNYLQPGIISKDLAEQKRLNVFLEDIPPAYIKSKTSGNASSKTTEPVYRTLLDY